MRSRNALATAEDLSAAQPPPSRSVQADLDLVDAGGAFRVDCILDELGIRPADLARALGTSPQQVSGWRKAGAVRPSKAEVVTFLNLLVRIITVLRALFADAGPERRRLWMQNPQIRLKCERPIDVVLSGKGEQVFDLLWGAYSGDVSL